MVKRRSCDHRREAHVVDDVEIDPDLAAILVPIRLGELVPRHERGVELVGRILLVVLALRGLPVAAFVESAPPAVLLGRGEVDEPLQPRSRAWLLEAWPVADT